MNDRSLPGLPVSRHLLLKVEVEGDREALE